MKSSDPDISEESQRELAAGVLKQTAQDLRRFRSATSNIERKLYLDAYRWVMSDDDSWPFSFPNVCRLLNRIPEDLRHELIGDLSLGPFTQCVRRCQRAIHRLSDPLIRPLPAGPHLAATPPTSLLQTSH
jgi:hypothetical protein